MRPALVVDASAVVHLLLADDVGARVAEALAGHVVVAPAHLDAEVLSALVRLQRAGTLERATLADCLDDLARLPATRWALQELLADAAVLTAHASAYDALYLALADRVDGRVVTADRRLARAHPDLTLVP